MRMIFRYTSLFVLAAIACAAAVRVSAQAAQRPDTITVSLVRCERSGDGPCTDKEVLKEVVIPTSKIAKATVTLTGDQGQVTTELAVEQFRHAHPQGATVRLRFSNSSASAWRLQAVAVDRTGKLLNLGSNNLSLKANAVAVSSPLVTEAEEIMYIVSVLPADGHYGMDFSQGFGVSRGSSGINGAAMMTNIGATYEGKGDYERSAEFYEAWALLSKGAKDYEGEAAAYNNLGLVNFRLSHYELSVRYYQLALGALDNLPEDDPKRLAGEAGVDVNLGLTYSALSRADMAVRRIQKALAIRVAAGDLPGQLIALNNLGSVYNTAGNYKLAAENFEKALALADKLSDDKGIPVTLNNLASAKRAMGDLAGAEKLLARSLDLSLASDQRVSAAFAYNNLGLLWMTKGDPAKAAGYYERALQTFRAIGNRAAEAVALSNLMFTTSSLGQNRLAIFYGKQAVNRVQGMRVEFAKLDEGTRKAFVDSRGDTYRKLAQLLISDGQIPEAEEVLGMLKEDEYLSFVRRDSSVSESLKGTVTLTPQEEKALSEYEANAKVIVAAAEELGSLEQKRIALPRGASLDAADQQAYDTLKAKYNNAVDVFTKYLDGLKTRFTAQDKRVELAANRTTVNLLKDIREPRTVIIQTIVADDALNIILTTANLQKAYVVKVRRDELNEMVAKFRRAATDPSLDPRPLGGKLYEKLFPAELSADLKAVKADTLVWSLDGTLRYVPLAALWDGQKYLAESYRLATLTLAAVPKVTKPVAPQPWQAFGVGVSRQSDGFVPLPAVPRELCSIIRDPAKKDYCVAAGGSGSIDGYILTDDEFTLKAFTNELGRAPVVHIASHFALKPGDETASFLLLGGGDERHFSLADLRHTDLSNVELLTLSACNTAMSSGSTSGGSEVENFGTLAQMQGARSVMASLWPVADASTQILMSEFYRLKTTEPACRSRRPCAGHSCRFLADRRVRVIRRAGAFHLQRKRRERYRPSRLIQSGLSHIRIFGRPSFCSVPGDERQQKLWYSGVPDSRVTKLEYSQEGVFMRSKVGRAFLVAAVVLTGMAGVAAAQQCGRGDTACLIRKLTEQIRVNPDEPENYYDRATVYRDTEQYALAKADIDKYLGFNNASKTNLADGYRVKAWVSHKLGDDKTALENIDKAFAVNPDENEGYYMRGMIYNDQKAYAKAAAAVTRYIEINAARPEFLADGLYIRAFAYNRDGKYDLAIADLTKSIGMDPTKPHVYTERAFAYRKLGKNSLADADERKANQLAQ